MIKKEYTRDHLTVIWQPDLCIHSGVCFRRLPVVFKPRERPWIRMEGAELSAIERTVHACPSGALSIKELEIEPSPNEEIIEEAIQVKIFENGPLRILGPCEVTMPDGTVVVKPNGASFCRCGGSSNKPFCDGTHKTNGFTG